MTERYVKTITGNYVPVSKTLGAPADENAARERAKILILVLSGIIASSMFCLGIAIGIDAAPFIDALIAWFHG